MISRDVEIINRLGLHARAAAKLVDCAARFSSRLTIAKAGNTVDAKSIMSVMMLAAGKGTLVTLSADGRDEQAALDALTTLINNRFDEAD
jgi:phosphocarrier protein